MSEFPGKQQMVSSALVPLQYGEVATGPTGAAHPGLWNGLCASWVPRLGPTGQGFRDCGPHKLHTSDSGSGKLGWTRSGYYFDKASPYDYKIVNGRAISDLGPMTLFLRLTVDEWVSGLLTKSFNSTFGWWLHYWVNEIRFAVTRSVSNYYHYVPAFPLHQPYSLAVTWTGSFDADQTKIYYDGVEQWAATGSTGGSGGHDSDAAQPLWIGAGMHIFIPAYRYMQGEIEALHIWNRVLGKSEIDLLSRDWLAPLRPVEHDYALAAGSMVPKLVAMAG